MCATQVSNGRKVAVTSEAEGGARVTLKQVATFALCVGGIYTAYLTQGFVSEKLAKSRYGAQQEAFPQLQSIVGLQCLSCCIFAAVLGRALESHRARDFPPFWRYAWIGVTNVVGPSCGLVALRNISYPAQVLAKSCKSVPIMISGALIYGKRYRTLEYASAAVIGLGVGLFAILGNRRKAAELHQDADPALGYALVLVNLALDSMTNADQDEINRVYPRNSALHMMCWTNFWGGLYYSTYLFGLTRAGLDVLAFCMRHKDALGHLLAFCLCGAFGQLFIFYTISTQGSLICSIVCTTRKFFSILMSVLLAGTVLTGGQWGAVALVFIGLLYKSMIRLLPRRRGKQA